MEDELHGFDGRVKLKKHDERGATWMDQERTKLQAYEYLCHIGEAKDWIEACVEYKIGEIDKLDEELRNGIVLAHLSKFFHPSSVKKIFEDTSRLQFRHSDNINYFFAACKAVQLPDVFMFELTDLYEKKNIPKVIYCIHALSHFLAKKGMAPKIKNLLGKLEFSEDVLKSTADGLEESGVTMPSFATIQDTLAAELDEPEPEPVKEPELTEEESIALFILERWQYMKEHEKQIITVQAVTRGKLVRTKIQKRNEILKSNEQLFSKLKAMYKGKKQRKEYTSLLELFKNNEPSAIKIQAWWRGRVAANQYKKLRMQAGHTDIKSLQKYITLFDDNITDIEEETNLDKLRQEVVKKIRDNLAVEAMVNGLDAKIALLVKNRITIEEVVHFNSKQMRNRLALELAVRNEVEGGIITLKGSDKATKAKRKGYGELFYLLQTQPRYLGSLLYSMNKFGGNISKFLEGVVLSLFGYAQNPREEYLFLNLIENCIKIEIQDVQKAEDLWRENPVFIKLVLQFTRGAKERRFLRELLSSLIKQVMDDSSLELETEPIAIYRQIIREEELRTGEKSTKPYDISPAEALLDFEVRKIQGQRYEKLVSITDTFLKAITASLKTMPFGIRYIAMSMKDELRKKFHGQENESEINKFAGNLIYYRYINPAIVAPEAFDVIDGAIISPIQRKNLAEVAKLLHQVQVNKLYTGDEQSILNNFVTSAGSKFAAFVKEASLVESLQEHFEMNEFVDETRQEKPTIYITPEEVIQVHINLAENLNKLCPDSNDPLSIILNELGQPPAVDSGAKGPGSEVILQLSNRFAKEEDPKDLEKKKIIADAKRLIMIIIRIATGKSLLKLLEEPSSEIEQGKFHEFIRILSTKQDSIVHTEDHPKVDSLSYLKNEDGTFMTFGQLKKAALEKMSQLEALQVVSQSDEYLSMLDMIADDMLTKQRRSAQRKRELKVLQSTMVNLNEKAAYLQEQQKSYNDYIEACMGQLQNKTKSKAKKPMLFSKQYYHVRDLQKSGKMPKFGSFKYTAQDLYKKGVLISIDDYSPKQYNGITLTISSNEAGVFNVEASFLGVSVAEKMELRLEDLLQNQYNKVDVIQLFDMAKVNLNLLIFLINKKFYI